MADNGKRRQKAEIWHSNSKSGSANRMVVSKFTPEVHKLPFLRMRSTNVAKMAANATICSTFEVQYGKSTSVRTTAIGHLGYL